MAPEKARGATRVSSLSRFLPYSTVANLSTARVGTLLLRAYELVVEEGGDPENISDETARKVGEKLLPIAQQPE